MWSQRGSVAGSQLQRHRRTYQLVCLVILLITLGLGWYTWLHLPPSLLSSCELRPPDVGQEALLQAYQRDLHRRECFFRQRDHFFQTTLSLIDLSKPLVLLEFPFHWNLGDTLIWKGELELLGELGVFPDYTCAFPDCSLDDIAKIVKEDGTILLHGGGNFGDIYRVIMDFRAKVIRRFTNNPIILFPQSIEYRDERMKENDGAFYSNNSHVHLMVRDSVSYRLLQRHFPNNPRYLVPDASVFLAPLQRNCQPSYDVVLILRKDSEGVLRSVNHTKAFEPLRAAGLSFIQRDWEDVVKDLPRHVTRYPLHLSSELTMLRIQLVNNALCRGKVIVTDRLHGMLSALYLGIPVVAMDNSYGKLMRYHSTWFASSACSKELLDVHPAANLESAVQKAFALVKSLQR